jgi:hypothetical protein
MPINSSHFSLPEEFLKYLVQNKNILEITGKVVKNLVYLKDHPMMNIYSEHHVLVERYLEI